MKIQRLRIDGFGHFADKELGPFDRPVSVFYGPNEAGKSTLLEFIRRVFFGFPDGRSRANHYPPMAGGRHGGSVTFITDGGETVIVQRIAGAGGGPLTLTTAAGVPLREAELVRLLGHPLDVFQSVSTFTLDELHSDEMLRNDSINSQIYSAGMGAARLPGALRTMKAEKEKLFKSGGRTQAIYDTADQLREIDAKLRDVANNATEYGRLTARLETIGRELEGLDNLHREYQSLYEQEQRLVDAWEDWNALDEVGRRLDQLPVIDDFPAKGVSRLEALEERVQTAERERQTASRKAEDLRPKAKVRVAHENILDYSPGIRRLERGRDSFDSSVDSLPQREGEHQRLQESLDEVLKDLGHDWDTTRLEEFDMSLVVRDEIARFGRRLREEDKEVDRRIGRLDQATYRLEEAMEAEQRATQALSLATQSGNPEKGKAAALIATIGFVAGVGLLALGAILGGTALSMGIVGGLAVLAIAAYLFVSRQPTASARVADARPSTETDNIKTLRKRMKKAEEDVEEAKNNQHAVQEQWRQWLSDRRLQETLSPETAGEFRTKLELGRTHFGNVRDSSKRIKAIQEDIDNYADVVEPLAKEFDTEFDRGDLRIVAAAADKLVALHNDVAGKVKARMEAMGALETADSDLIERERDLGDAKDERLQLLQSGGAADAEEFRKRADIYGERAKLKEHQRDIRGRLQRLSGPGDAFEALMKRLEETTDLQAINNAVRKAEEATETIATEARDLSTERGEVQQARRDLVSEEESSRLRMERSQLAEKIQGHAREWAAYAIAENLLREAQSKFERERQPDIIRNSQDFFCHITRGQYQTVVPSLEKREIHVTDRSGRTRQPNELSRGTREQLFLSLRFGYIRYLGERAERLPVLVDEALVNFDPERGENAAAAFTELAQTNQVLVFTCHPQIVEWFRTAAVRLGEDEPQVIDI